MRVLLAGYMLIRTPSPGCLPEFCKGETTENHFKQARSGAKSKPGEGARINVIFELLPLSSALDTIRLLAAKRCP